MSFRGAGSGLFLHLNRARPAVSAYLKVLAMATLTACNLLNLLFTQQESKMYFQIVKQP